MYLIFSHLTFRHWNLSVQFGCPPSFCTFSSTPLPPCFLITPPPPRQDARVLLQAGFLWSSGRNGVFCGSVFLFSGGSRGQRQDCSSCLPSLTRPPKRTGRSFCNSWRDLVSVCGGFHSYGAPRLLTSLSLLNSPRLLRWTCPCLQGKEQEPRVKKANE